MQESQPQHLQVKATIPQGRFLVMPQRFRAFVAGYGSGKTYVGSMQMCRGYLELPGFNQGYFAPTYPQIRDIFFPSIEEVAFNFGLNVEIKEGNKEVHFYTGRQFRGTTICRSMERAHTIIGFKISHALIDEIDILALDKAKMAWRKIIARMRYKNAKNSIDVTTTPEGFLFTYQTFVKQLQDKQEMAERYALIQASTHDNAKNLPPDYIPSLIEAYPKELVAAYLDGQFVNMRSGTVYYAFDRKTHNSTETIKEKEPLFIGMDFNVQHMAASIYVQRPSGWHVVEELKDVFDTPAMIAIIKERWKDKGHNIVVYPDATGGSRKSVDALSSDIILLRQAGFTIRQRTTNPSVRGRVLSVNKQLQSGQLWVNVSRCPVVTECLEQQIYDQNGEPDKASGKDHQNDATGYPIAYEFPIKHRAFGKSEVAGYY
jgi:hypothetical protein